MTLPRINIAKWRIDQPICTPDGKPTAAFVRWLNDTNSKTENIDNAQSDQIDLIETALTNAGIALTTANAVAKTNALAASFTDPGAILTADVSTADATKATITVANHTRRYADGTSVSVTGGSIDLLQQGKTYYVVYDQSSRLGGTVTYQALGPVEDVPTTYIDAGQATAAHPDRHLCGNVLTPTTAVPAPTFGGGPRPAGTGPYVPRELIP
jgi:hypothetical protein